MEGAIHRFFIHKNSNNCPRHVDRVQKRTERIAVIHHQNRLACSHSMEYRVSAVVRVRHKNTRNTVIVIGFARANCCIIGAIQQVFTLYFRLACRFSPAILPCRIASGGDFLADWQRNAWQICRAGRNINPLVIVISEKFKFSTHVVRLKCYAVNNHVIEFIPDQLRNLRIILDVSDNCFYTLHLHFGFFLVL